MRDHNAVAPLLYAKIHEFFHPIFAAGFFAATNPQMSSRGLITQTLHFSMTSAQAGVLLYAWRQSPPDHLMFLTQLHFVFLLISTGATLFTTILGFMIRHCKRECNECICTECFGTVGKVRLKDNRKQ